MQLASGFDALYLSGHGLVRAETLEELAHQRDLAEARLPASLSLGPLSFAVAPHGWGKYRYCLEHPVGRVGVSPSRHLPPLRIQPRSEFLHALGPARAVETFEQLLGAHCIGLGFSVSRADLYVDVTSFPLETAMAGRFVCRGEARRSYETAGRCSGFDFGSRRTGSLYARVYDKLLDVERTGHDWWFEIWGEDHEGDGPVTRVEFEIGRQGLGEFSLDSPAEVLDGAPGLWRYATGEWLTYRSPTADSNRTRWPLAPEWRVVQEAALAGAEGDLERLRARGRAGSLRRLTPGLIGYLVGFAALVGTVDIDDTLAALDGHVRNDEIVRRKRFADRVERRRAEGQIA